MTSQADFTIEAVIQAIALLGPEIWLSGKGESFDITLQVPKAVKGFLDEFLEITSERVLGNSPENTKNNIFRTLVLRGLIYSALGGDKLSEVIETIYSGILPAEERPNSLFEALDKISTDELKEKER